MAQQENNLETSSGSLQYAGWDILRKGKKIRKCGLNKSCPKFVKVYLCKTQKSYNFRRKCSTQHLEKS